jgi:glycerol uptake facilitator-like aquaporin
MTQFDLARRLAAEALGTFFLLAAIVGSGIMGEQLAGDNLAVVLIGNTLATAAALIVLIVLFAPVSGAHFNPAVTLAFLLRREITPGTAGVYIATQIVSGIAGVMAVHLMFDQALVQISPHVRYGAGQWLGEGIATFGLVMTILGAVRWRPSAVPYAVGLYIAAAMWFTSSTSFANPAVTIARVLTDSFSGIAPDSALPFIAAQLLGAALATAVMGWLLAPAAAAERDG